MIKVIDLGSKVRDTITTLEGTAVARIEYLNGCVRYEIQPKGLKDGKMLDAAWIDVHQIEVLEEIQKDNAEAKKGPGGPGNMPTAFSCPE